MFELSVLVVFAATLLILTYAERGILLQPLELMNSFHNQLVVKKARCQSGKKAGFFLPEKVNITKNIYYIRLQY